MTEDELDNLVLATVSNLIDIDTKAVRLIQKLWSDRAQLIRDLEVIETWDMTHSEALSIKRVIAIVEYSLSEVRDKNV